MRRDHVLQFVLEAAQTPDFQGVTAQAVADALSIWRNDAAVELNKLVAEGKLRRVGKKNVRFFPASEETADIRPEPAVQEEPPQAEEETGQYRAFSGLVGADGSLKYQLRVAMAAVAYPPNGLNMLITGSTGSGYAMAQAIGHTIIEPTGSLVPLVEKGHDCAKMQGLALKNIAVKLVNAKGKTVYEDFGELLFTHFGLSGPVILSASAHMARGEAGYTVRIDLKPALDEKTLDARILRDFSAAQNRDFENSLSALLPRSMIPVVIARSGIDPMQKVNSITKQQRRALLETIKCFSVPIACKAPVEDAIVTSGGVKVSEVNAKTMESKLVQGLYFAGELLDVDAYTGGFNLQIAWATGRLAGLSAAAKEFQKPEDAT